MVRDPIDYDVYTTEQLLKMSREDATENLSERQQRFCEQYTMNHNIKTALMRAGYSDTSTAQGYMMRRKPKVQKYIQWLKARILNETLITGTEVIDQWIRIAFADMTDFVNIHPTYITLKKAEEMDGQLVKSIKVGKDGVAIELYDKLRALENIAKYASDMPKDFNQLIAEQKQRLLEQEFELKKKMYDIENSSEEDDGFIEALKESAKVVWETEKD